MIDPKRQAALRDAIESFFFAYRAFTAGPDRILGERGLGRVHHRILYFVGRSPGVAINALLDTLGVTKQALNAPLRRLVGMKLVSVRTATHDRRYKELRLTREGERLEARLTGTQMAHLGATFAATGNAAEASWRRVMERVRESS